MQACSQVRNVSASMHCSCIQTTKLLMFRTRNYLLAEAEVEEFVPIASALLINIGTLSTPWVRSMHKAAAKAQELGKVWVLDPVGVGATNIRTKTATDLTASYKPTAIRGNPSEIMALAKSVCSGKNLQTSGELWGTVKALLTPWVLNQRQISFSKILSPHYLNWRIALVSCESQTQCQLNFLVSIILLHTEAKDHIFLWRNWLLHFDIGMFLFYF